MQILPTDLSATTLASLVLEGANATLSLNSRQDGGDDIHDDGDDDTPTVAKVTSMVVLFSVSMVCGLVPFKLVRWFNLNPASPSGGTHLFLIRLLLSFGGGALLSTTFLHLLPEINHSIEELVATGALPAPEDLPFPLGEFLLTSGFFMIYLTEELVHCWMHRRSANARARARKQTTSDEKGGTMMVEPAKHDHSHGHSHLPIGGNVTAVYPVTDIDGTPAVPQPNSNATPPPAPANVNGPLRGLLIVLALSIHELFEGLAVGLERSPSAVWLLFGAVASHKFVIAFCVAFELLVASVRFRIAVAYIFVYSVVSPIGIGIGIALSSVNDDTSQTIEVVSVILQGLASGTLIYVIFFEILAKDAGHSHGSGGSGNGADDDHPTTSATHGLWQFFAVLVGFGLLLGIKIATGHGHDHGHGSDGDHDHDHDHNH
ncbi:zinc transporter ZIP1-like [Anopheles ziemanni]|uniref:zinc transporter ZIP1-like n=1 Tax=Anopheles coustani TaxID=139045 RepID=UPI00265B5CE0|nr:zinc transporter ZIP1-like [Anopheles coustani]XP_058174480.1 zinc transporter ZIP1-like [Anopheles ziemanni]